MQPEDLILVSVDDHLVEPPTLFEGKMPIRFANDAPWVIREFDPFEYRTREQRTVGALRAKADEQDVAIRSFDHARFVRTVGVSLGSMSAKLNG